MCILYLGINYLSMIMIAGTGQAIGGAGTSVTPDEPICVLYYANVATAIAGQFDLLSEIYVVLGIPWLTVTFYSLAVFVFVVKRTLDKGLGTAFVTVIVAWILKTNVMIITDLIISAIFGGTYSIV